MYDEREAAYAVIVGEKIDVKTVSETRRAAIVNWLVVKRERLVFSWTTDEEIEQIWEALKGDATVATVEVSLALPLI